MILKNESDAVEAAKKEAIINNLRMTVFYCPLEEDEEKRWGYAPTTGADLLAEYTFSKIRIFLDEKGNEIHRTKKEVPNNIVLGEN